MADLKPCPFCGGSPVVRVPGETDGFAIHIRCRCGIELYGAKAHFPTAESATDAWNTRAAERAGGGVVDDAMVERAYVAYAKDPPGSEGMVPEERRAAKMRAALTAALYADGEGSGNG